MTVSAEAGAKPAPRRLRRADQRQHRRDRGEGDAHHHGKADADAGKTEGLHQRREAAGENVGADEKGALVGRQARGAGEDERHRDGAGVHHENMLQPEGGEARRRQKLVDGV